ncbi:MAG: isochorismate synthase [Candidatus Sericytochromatia bacterium]|nr:isochorismate synthase [Candidatus Sericytochromatia bacterium]
MNQTELCLAPWLSPAQEAALSQQLAACAERSGPQQLRLLLDLTPAALPGWLAAQNLFPRCFWTQRKGAFQTAAVGQLQSWSDLTQVSAFLKTAPAELRVYGGWAFQPGACLRKPWQDWPEALFFLPEAELRAEADGVYLCLNLRAEPAARPAALQGLLARLCPPRDLSDAPPRLQPLQHQPDRKAWQDMLQEALVLLSSSGPLDKLVLSRCSQSPMPDFDLRMIPRLLQTRRQAYYFWLQPQPEQVLWGASPERLYARQGVCLQTEALAGTRTWSADPLTNHHLQRDLLASAKERAEQERVLQHLLQRLEPLSRSCRLNPLEIVVAGPVQHLYRRLEAELLPGVSDAQLVAALHPTPAVNGFPAERSPRYIQQLEPHARGWYTGALGWISADAAEWAVTLRAALWQNQQQHFFTGAGIMPSSEPESEWLELNAKLQSLLALFDV